MAATRSTAAVNHKAKYTPGSRTAVHDGLYVRTVDRPALPRLQPAAHDLGARRRACALIADDHAGHRLHVASAAPAPSIERWGWSSRAHGGHFSTTVRSPSTLTTSAAERRGIRGLAVRVILTIVAEDVEH